MTYNNSSVEVSSQFSKVFFAFLLNLSGPKISMLVPLENLVEQCDFILEGERDGLKIFSQLN